MLYIIRHCVCVHIIMMLLYIKIYMYIHIGMIAASGLEGVLDKSRADEVVSVIELVGK